MAFKTLGMNRYPIEFMSPEGAVDYLEVDGCGIIRIHGWYKGFNEKASTRPGLRLNDGREIEPINLFRVQRGDVSRTLNTEYAFLGVVFEYHCPTPLIGLKQRSFAVYWGIECIAKGLDNTSMELPAYPYLLNDERIFHRDWIYCSGLPVEYLNPEVFSIAKTLSEPILDLGCGTGTLADALRTSGLECSGLELDRAEIQKAIPSHRNEFIKLYSGSLPLPYAAGTFSSVIFSEVLEHLENPEAMMSEIARICQGSVLVTVPDMSAVALNFKNGVVPWHLLESTHVNFFNPRSLPVFLGKWFSHVELFRIGRSQTNDTQWWGGLMALARK